MKLSEMIKALQAVAKEHGDLECVRVDYTNAVRDHPGPNVEQRLVLRGREWKDRLWSPHLESHAGRAGEKVVLL